MKNERNSKAAPELQAGDVAEVYGIFDPVSGELRYVGKARCAQSRFKAHLRERRRKTPLYLWMQKTLQARHVPIMRVLAVVEQSAWQFEERRIIFEARLGTRRLLNVAAGGDRPDCPAQTRRINAATATRKRTATPKQKAIWRLKLLLGQGLKAGYVNNAVREKLRRIARLDPITFALWLNLPDRQEAAPR